jgi:hypothetical protein
MSNKNEYIKKHEYETIKLSEIYNDIGQVRKKTAQKDIDKIEDSIKSIGQQTAIGVCFSEITKNPDNDYKYHLIYGQKRMLATANLGRDLIEAKIYLEPKIWTKEQILIEAFAENYADTEMDKTEVWDTIKELYSLYDHSIKKVQAATGIRYQDIASAVRTHEIKKIQGGAEILEIIIDDATFKLNKVEDIITPCLIDLKTLDLEKAKDFHNKLTKVKPNAVENVLKVAKQHPSMDVDTWIADGELMKRTTERRIPFEETQEVRIKAYAKELGMSFNDFVVQASLDAITVDVEDTDEPLED